MSNYDFKELAKKYHEEALDSLTKFVQINSVYDEKTQGINKPFGNGVASALKFIQELGEKEGFKTDSCQGYATEISYGEGDVDIAIFAHADVVPASGEWKYDPFGGEKDDKYIYGRGVSDDKGAGIAAFYALKLLKDNNLIDNYKVRLVIGGNEERGSACMRYYFNVLRKDAPTYGFTPDAEFPLIYGEKGITNYETSLDIDLSPIISVRGGKVSNSVIDRFVVTLPSDERFVRHLKENNYEFEKQVVDNVYKITFIGKSAHGSTPEEGINAGIVGLKAISRFYKNEKLAKFVSFYEDYNGKNLGAYEETPLLGKTTFNVGLITYKDNKLTFTVNFRYPETVKYRETLKKINKLTGAKINILSNAKVLLFDPESDLVQTLLNVYQEETNDYESKPLAIGGGTYAKECPNTIAFGCAFKGRPGNIHAPNEYLLIEDFYLQIAIYAHAIMALARLGKTKCE
ncbi:MAG: Sapep family Mn(2+)-dependent dipeptidase [Bacilli bacterium]|jgi:succinyl-diaminopimelate desuccinylase